MFQRSIRLMPVALLLPAIACGWGQEGHRLIAAIAARNLKPAAAAKVRELLGDGETLESISSWADQVRPQRPETSTWHYINIPITESRTSGRGWKEYCPEAGCAPGIIGEMMRRLRDANLDRAQRAEALKFLVHFTSDLHQPLHSGDMGDKGGNEVAVVYKDRATNLHSIWDTALLMDWLAARPAEKARLEQGPGFWAKRSMSKGSVEDWLWEAHDVARDVAYKNLPEARPAQLGGAYLEAAGPSIRRQLERAGVRLARLLNEALAE
jgi:hypothetical protein